jgi:hypothetical protein
MPPLPSLSGAGTGTADNQQMSHVEIDPEELEETKFRSRHPSIATIETFGAD